MDENNSFFPNGTTSTSTDAPTSTDYIIGGTSSPVSNPAPVAENTSTDTVRRVASYIPLGNSVTVENAFEFRAEATVEYLCESEFMSLLDSGVLSQFPKYCSFIAESDGALISIPAKVILMADETNPTRVRMTVKINQTKFSAGTKGTLSFTVVK